MQSTDNNKNKRCVYEICISNPDKQYTYYIVVVCFYFDELCIIDNSFKTQAFP